MSANILLWRLASFTDWILTKGGKQLPFSFWAVDAAFFLLLVTKRPGPGQAACLSHLDCASRSRSVCAQTFTACMEDQVRACSRGLLTCWEHPEVDYGAWDMKMKWRKRMGEGSKERRKGKQIQRRNSERLQEKGLGDTGHAREHGRTEHQGRPLFAVPFSL